MPSSWPKVRGFVGLHAKSYTWMVAFDTLARNFLSTIYNSPGLDRYYTNSLRRYHTYQDRHKETTKYLNYLVTSDESRINWMYLSKSFSRKTFVELLSYMGFLLSSKKEEDIYELYRSWAVSDFLRLRVKVTKEKINDLLGLMYHYLKSLVIKLLLTNRAKERAYDADKLRTEAFNVLLSMLEKYQLHHSGFKVPFTSQLMWLAKPKKKEIVEYEMWGLGEDAKILSLDMTDLEGEDYSSTENRTIHLEAIDKIQQESTDLAEGEMVSANVEEALGLVPTQLRDFLFAVTGINQYQGDPNVHFSEQGDT